MLSQWYQNTDILAFPMQQLDEPFGSQGCIRGDDGAMQRPENGGHSFNWRPWRRGVCVGTLAWPCYYRVSTRNEAEQAAVGYKSRSRLETCEV